MLGKVRIIGILSVVVIAAIIVVSLVSINSPNSPNSSNSSNSPNDPNTPVPKKESNPYWLYAGGNEYRTGLSHEVINANFSNIAWSRNITGDCTTIDANGSLYFVGVDGKLTSINTSGEVMWSAPLVGQACYSPFLGPDGMIHQLTENSGSYYVTTFDSNGHMEWSTNISIGSLVEVINFLRAPLVLSDGSVVLSYLGYNVTSDGNVVNDTSCLLRIDNSGSLMWCVATPTYSGVSAPSQGRDGSILIVLFYENTVLSYALNGTLNWSASVNLPSGETLREFITVGPDGTIYVPTISYPSSQVDLVALNPNGSVKWFCQINPDEAWYGSLNIGGPVALSPTGDVIVSTSTMGNNGWLFDIAPNGTIRWQQVLDSPRWVANPAVVDAEGNILACSASSLFEFDKNGNLLQKFNAPGTVDSIVIGQGGQVYCSSKGQLIAFGTA